MGPAAARGDHILTVRGDRILRGTVYGVAKQVAILRLRKDYAISVTLCIHKNEIKKDAAIEMQSIISELTHITGYGSTLYIGIAVVFVYILPIY